MLEKLDQVDWQNLHHAYGDASDVPGLIRALASNDAKVRSDAVYALFGNIWHQGTVYEATWHAVPFLVELLESPAVDGKVEILHLLKHIGTGNSYLDVHQGLETFREVRSREDFPEQLQEELAWVRAANDAVVRGISTYAGLLHDPDSDTRMMAASVLTTCLDQAQEVEAALRHRLVVENDPAVKTALIMELGKVWQHARGDAGTESVRNDLLQDWLRQGSDPAVRLAAAVGLLRRDSDQFAGQALPVINEMIGPSWATFEKLPEADEPVSAVSKALAADYRTQVAWLLEILSNADARVRRGALWNLEGLCRHWRPVAALVAPRLAALLADPDAETREAAGRQLRALGSARWLAVSPLQALLSHPSEEICQGVARLLESITQDRLDYEGYDWLADPEPDRDLDELLLSLEESLASQEPGRLMECLQLIPTLAAMGAAAKKAAPLLIMVLERGESDWTVPGTAMWVRVDAARALWKVDGRVPETLPVLLQELKCGLPGMKVLACLEEMGPLAQEAIPVLRTIIESEARLVEIGSVDLWIAMDEAYRGAAQRALERIQRPGATYDAFNH